MTSSKGAFHVLNHSFLSYESNKTRQISNLSTQQSYNRKKYVELSSSWDSICTLGKLILYQRFQRSELNPIRPSPIHRSSQVFYQRKPVSRVGFPGNFDEYLCMDQNGFCVFNHFFVLIDNM